VLAAELVAVAGRAGASHAQELPARENNEHTMTMDTQGQHTFTLIQSTYGTAGSSRRHSALKYNLHALCCFLLEHTGQDTHGDMEKEEGERKEGATHSLGGLLSGVAGRAVDNGAGEVSGHAREAHGARASIGGSSLFGGRLGRGGSSSLGRRGLRQTNSTGNSLERIFPAPPFALPTDPHGAVLADKHARCDMQMMAHG